ncbi:MAG: saccharopine dehydrogenase family protein [Planctomycetota bacterium]|jgi:hypothetical protein
MNEPLQLDFSHRNYRSIVLAGLGAVGEGILAVGQTHLDGFEQVHLVDKAPCRCQAALRYHYPVRQMDIEDGESLTGFLTSLKTPVLLINACTDIDTVKLRKVISMLPVGYIDICESRTPDNPQGRFTVSMPYTNQSCHGDRPHLICQGSNPGMVEYIARMLIDRMGPDISGYRVNIYENDQLSAPNSDESRFVSWSPESLVDEVMVAPLIEYADGRMVEGPVPVSERVTTQWQGRPFGAFKVGHEDIWNLGCLEQVSDATFYYGFCADVMNILRTTPQNALATLRIPAGGEPIGGLERIVVSVKDPSGEQQSLLWQVDHSQTRRDYGINAVQYQTAASVLLSVLLMQHTEAGCWAGTYNASTLPLGGGDWDVIRQLMDRLGISWQPVPKGYVYCVDKSSVVFTS